MANLTESDLKLFVDAVKRYMTVTTREEPLITSAYLGGDSIEAHEFNGVVTFSGAFNGHVMVSMPPQLLRELLLMQHETNLSEANMLDAVGEIANTLAGNARKQMGSELDISVPITFHGSQGMHARVRQRPYVITFRWNHQPALVSVDMEKTG